MTKISSKDLIINSSQKFIQTSYNRLRHTGEVFTEPSATQQHFKSECDINTIMKKYIVTGTIPQVAGAFYSDLPDVSDYFSLVNYISDTEEAFMSLPSDIRKRFDNDPGYLAEFLSNPANESEAIALGLLAPPEVPSPSLKPNDLSPPILADDKSAGELDNK